MCELVIELEKEIIEACEQRIKGTEFDSVDEYITFITEEVVSSDMTEIQDAPDLGCSEDQLQALGYID